MPNDKGKVREIPAGAGRTCPTGLTRPTDPPSCLPSTLDAPPAPRYGSGNESLDSASFYYCTVSAGFSGAVTGALDLHSGRGVALRVRRRWQLATNDRTETIGRSPGSF